MRPLPRLISFVGVVIFLFSSLQAIITLRTAEQYLELSIDFLLISAPGVVLFYAGFWIADSAIDPQYYPRLIAWLLGGLVVMFGFVILRDLHPGVTVEWSLGTQALALTIGLIGGVLIGIQETTAKMQTERLTQQNKTLEQYSEQLEEREQKLKQQNKQLDQFAGVVSHDLRNPLGVAQGRLEILAEEYDSVHIEPIDRSLTRMEELIEDLLTLARQGDRVSEFEATDLTHLSESCWSNVATPAATLQVTTTHSILADPMGLQQLLENLFRNAVEHEGGDVTITVNETDDGFYVEDDGGGIPENKRDEIFDAGYSTANMGTGLGLSIVKQIADAHNWDICVTEGSSGGARFEITNVEFAA